jgi:hypothetical protein
MTPRVSLRRETKIVALAPSKLGIANLTYWRQIVNQSHELGKSGCRVSPRAGRDHDDNHDDNHDDLAQRS